MKDGKLELVGERDESDEGTELGILVGNDDGKELGRADSTCVGISLELGCIDEVGCALIQFPIR